MNSPATDQQPQGRTGGAAPRRRQRLGRWLILALLSLLIPLLVPSEGYLGPAFTGLALNRAVQRQGFRLGAWELDAWRQKLADQVNRPGADLAPQAQHDLVRDYFLAVGEMDRLDAEIRRAYADPQPGRAAAAAPLQRDVEALRAAQARRRPAVEAILQRQVSQVLQDEGLTLLDRVWPPVFFHFTESPDVLIISPRDRIVLQDSVYVQPEISIDQMTGMERQVEAELGVSALVEGTGGFSAYPTMVVSYDDQEWVLGTVAHEWFHTYLVFHPLGWHYDDSGATRTLNETAATIVGDEIGALTLARYYPELVPAPATALPAVPAGAGAGAARRPAFSFAGTMRSTRLRVDDLLAQGRVVEAESYMEAQRQVLVQHGYAIRRLNQAYFAFHGSYAVGEAATDPLGDKLRLLRQRSGTLREFVARVARLTDAAALDAALR